MNGTEEIVEGTTPDGNATTTTEEAKETSDKGMLDGETNKEAGGMLAGKTEQETSKPEVPESYDAFTLEDGTELGEEEQELYASFSKELGLTKEQALKLVRSDKERDAEMVKAYEKKDAENREAIKKKYGDGFKEADVTANKAFTTFFEDKEHRESLIKAGVVSDPAFFDAMVKLGKTIGEDSFVLGNKNVKSLQDRKLADSLQDT